MPRKLTSLGFPVETTTRPLEAWEVCRNVIRIVLAVAVLVVASSEVHVIIDSKLSRTMSVQRQRERDCATEAYPHAICIKVAPSCSH